ncbi:unnamed protein product [Angiostrongylus costaricensis]|uniref:DUF1907 domain-containing protein n=1 Tax=Angiostrongylus costaricensis TaxID=334426 RepID=A0A158PFA5_ANGCS|nr:unnamed protein product [Angiostrongylus costaricensis]
MSSNPILIETLKPSNSELLPIVESALKSNFKNVTVEVGPCPDLSAEPFSMTSSGFGQKLVIADVGGPGNLFPKIHKEKEFDLKICKVCQSPFSFVFGPGAGPWKVVGRNCEMVADANLTTAKVILSSGYVDPLNRRYMLIFHYIILNASRSLLFSLCRLVHCKCSVRIGKDNFPETIRKALAKHYGERCVSLAGIFLLREGEAKLHIMPDFPGCQFSSSEEVDKWLQFFTMKAPLVCASVFHSYDPGHKLRMEHTHCYSSHGDAGHYYYDTTPDTVAYEGWFTAAEKIYRIDEI